jgi:hypothetical protein
MYMESFGMSGVSGNKIDLSGSWTKLFSSSKSDSGVYPKDFHKFPGTMQDLYNKAAIKIGLPHVKANANAPANPLVVRELNRENTKFHIEIKTPQQQAARMISDATSSLPILGKSVDTLQIANEMMAIRRELPNLSGGIESEVMKQLGNAGDQSRFAQDLRTVAGYPARADYELRTMAGADAIKHPAIDRAQVNAEVNAIITDATSKGTINVKGEVIPVAVTFSTERVVAQLSALAETNPQKAQLLRSELTTRLTPAEAGAMNRMLAKDGGFIENAVVGLNDPGDAAIGAAKGVANDGIGILNVLGRGGALQAAADAEQNAAMLSLFGQDKAAAQSRQSADILRTAGHQDVIPSIPYKNAAQQGGANILTAAELASGAKAVYSGGKWLVKNAPEMLAKGGKQVDEVAEAGRKLMSNADVRAWYNDQIKALDTSGPLTEITARRVHDARNTLKQQARDMMADRAAAEQLTRDRPIEPFDHYVQKYEAQGYDGQALWVRIIEGGTTPNSAVNKKFGVE